MVFGITQNFLIFERNSLPCSFMERSKISPFGAQEQSGALLYGKRDLNKELAIMIKIIMVEIFRRDHGSVGGVVQAAQGMPFCLGEADTFLFPQ